MCACVRVPNGAVCVCVCVMFCVVNLYLLLLATKQQFALLKIVFGVNFSI